MPSEGNEPRQAPRGERLLLPRGYELLSQLSGGATPVYRARTPGGRTVAVEVFRSIHELALSEDFLARVAKTSLLQHPAIVPVAKCLRGPDQAWYVISEYIEGKTLREWADETGIPPLGQVVGLMRALCDVLALAARAGLVHGGLTPKRVLVLETPAAAVPTLKVLGLSVPHSVRTRAPSPEALPFMAPEQLRGLSLPIRQHPKRIDARVDVYACGCLLYYLCTGGPPCSRRDGEQALEEPARPLIEPSKINPAIPERLQAVIMRAMSERPEARYASAAELGRALAALPPFRETSASDVRPLIGAPPAPSSASSSPPVPMPDTSRSMPSPVRPWPDETPTRPSTAPRPADAGPGPPTGGKTIASSPAAESPGAGTASPKRYRVSRPPKRPSLQLPPPPNPDATSTSGVRLAPTASQRDPQPVEPSELASDASATPPQADGPSGSERDPQPVEPSELASDASATPPRVDRPSASERDLQPVEPGQLASDAPATPPEAGAGARTHRRVLVALVVTALVAGAAWWRLGSPSEAPSTPPVPVAPATAPPAATAKAPLPSPDIVAPERVEEGRPTSREPMGRRAPPPARPAPGLPEVSPGPVHKRPRSPAPRAVAEPPPRQRPAALEAPSRTADEVRAAPSSGEPEPDTARREDVERAPTTSTDRKATPVVQVPPVASRARPSESGQDAVPAPPPARGTPAPAPVKVNTRILGFRLEGSLATVVVGRAVARARGAFDACYRRSLVGAPEARYGRVAVSAVIDSRGQLVRPSVEGAPLPGLEQCITAVASRIKTRPQPGAGRIEVKWTIEYAPL